MRKKLENPQVKAQGLAAALIRAANDFAEKKGTTLGEATSSSSHPKKKKKKKKKKSKSHEMKSDSDSADSDSSSSSATSDYFDDRNKILKIAQKKPGRLTLLALREMHNLLSTVAGEIGNSGLVPIFGRFFHLIMKDKMSSAGQQREAATLSRALDLLVVGDTVGALDLLVQRLKALELAASHGNWRAAAHLELLPPDRPSTSSRQEQWVAAQAAKDDYKLNRLLHPSMAALPNSPSPRPPFKGNQKGGGKWNKGKWSSGKNRETHEAPKNDRGLSPVRPSAFKKK
jgi:hypothetical protein